MFDLDQFIADCQSALLEDAGSKAVREVIARAVSEPASVIKGLGAPQRSGVQSLYQSDNLTILNVIWGARMMIMPHNHEMWAIIGAGPFGLSMAAQVRYQGIEHRIVGRPMALNELAGILPPGRYSHTRDMDFGSFFSVTGGSTRVSAKLIGKALTRMDSGQF